MKYISRQNYKPNRKTWRWEVRIRDKRPDGIREYFYDVDYGGSDKAFEAAKKFLERKKKRLPKEFFQSPWKGKAWGKGICTRWFNKGEYSYLYAVAHWVAPDGTRGQKAYSCSKYGIKGAEKLALAYRSKMEKEHGIKRIER